MKDKYAVIFLLLGSSAVIGLSYLQDKITEIKKNVIQNIDTAQENISSTKKIITGTGIALAGSYILSAFTYHGLKFYKLRKGAEYDIEQYNYLNLSEMGLSEEDI